MSATRTRLRHRVSGLAAAALCAALALGVGYAPHDAYAAGGVVVVRGGFVGPGGEPCRDRAEAAYEAVTKLLRAAGLSYLGASDAQVERCGLAEAAVAVFPYNRAITSREQAQIAKFVRNGGRTLFFFTGPAELLAETGVCHRGWRRCELGSGELTMEVCGSLPGVGLTVPWATPQVADISVRPDGEVLGSWARGGLPAVVAGPGGAFIGALPTTATREHAALLRAVLGRLAPSLWSEAIATEPERVPLPARFASLADLWRFVAATGHEADLAPATDRARQALWMLGEAKAALDRDDPDQALALSQQASAVALDAFYASYPPVQGEMRGVWMHNYATPSWPQAMASLSQANINAVFPYMMSGGVAFYQSRVLPTHPDVRRNGDYLRQAVDAGRASGVPVHARMLNLSVLFASEGTKRLLRTQGRLAVNSVGRSVDWLCPTNPQNRKAQVAAALELADYGVAGIQLDYLRYPSRTTCYCAGCRREFESETGVRARRWPDDASSGDHRGRFREWRKAQITQIARSISGAVRARHPGVYVSAAVFLNWPDHADTFGQDWKAWVDEGLVDFVCPMNYTESPDTFAGYLAKQRVWVAGKVPIITGIGVHADGHHFPGPEMLVEQVRLAREAQCGGFVIFNYSPELVRDYLPRLAAGISREPTDFGCQPRALRTGGNW